MGLFNKLKNALFEEEEIDLPVKEVKEEKPITPVIKEEIKKPVPVIEKKEINNILDKENERELFKSENTFKFPDFDEEEFSSSYKPPIEEPVKKEPVITPKESFDRVKPITYEFDKKPRTARKENIKKEAPVEDKQKLKIFKPSPVISPVYGVLDKNYKKEDIITVKEEPKKKIDVDTIRRKAFGTLEDDIEMSFEKPKEDFYRNGSKSVDDLLKDSVDETIDINFDSRESRNERNYHNSLEDEEKNNSRLERNVSRRGNDLDSEEFSETINSEFEDENSKLQVLDEDTKNEEQKFEEDTLENDLFDLIDSMYDNREDDEN